MILRERFIKEYYKKLFEQYVDDILLILEEIDWNQFSSTQANDDSSAVFRAIDAMSKDPEGRKILDTHKQKQAKNFEDILTNSKVFLQKKGINIVNLKRLGSGAGGIAYAINNEKVLKITTDHQEAMVASTLKNKKIKGVVSIFDIWKFPNSNFYGIIMEKLLPFEKWPNDEMKQSMEEIVDTFNIKNLFNKHHGNWDDIWADINSSPLFKMAGKPQDLKNAFQILITIESNLKTAGIQNFGDVHIDNLGKRTNGEIVIFDI